MVTYYRTWEEANSKRQKWDRIYYRPGPGYGYYIVRPKRPARWGFF